MRRSALRSGWRSCEHCGAPLHERAWRHQSKRCPGYSDLWAMDTYVCFGENLKAHGREAVLFSVTAPGADQLPWDARACRVPGEHRHSGELGCQVEAGQALLWNESAQHRFSTAQREAKRCADRELRRLGSKRRVSKCLSWWELQKRGVLHAHVVLRCRGALLVAGLRARMGRDRRPFLVRVRGPLAANRRQGPSFRKGGPLRRRLHTRRRRESAIGTSCPRSSDAASNVPYQPSAHGDQQGHDAQRSTQPSLERGFPRKMRVASAIERRARRRAVVPTQDG